MTDHQTPEDHSLVHSATRTVQAAGRELFGLLGLHRSRGPNRTGLAPGSVVVDEDALDLHVTWMRFGPEHLEEHTLDSSRPLPEQLPVALAEMATPDSKEADDSAAEDNTSENNTSENNTSENNTSENNTVTWIQVSGLGDAERLLGLGSALGLHLLTLEDVANLDQRAKSEVFGDDRLIFLRCCDDRLSEKHPLRTWQTAVLLRPGVVITFAEGPSDVFEPVIARLRAGNRRIRSHGADYLAYALLDAVVDRYLVVLDSFRDLLDDIEDTILDDSVDLDLQRLHRLRRDLLRLHRIVPPVPPILAELASPGERDGPVFARPVRVFLRDCHDHALRATDLVGAYRDLASELLDLHLSVVGYRTNEVMKVLTMIATLFIPLSFIAGVYGMNFDRESALNMPELGWNYGYLMILGVMAVVAGGFVIFFKRRGWL